MYPILLFIFKLLRNETVTQKLKMRNNKYWIPSFCYW